MSSEDGVDVGSQIDKRVLLLNEFIHTNEGKPRESRRWWMSHKMIMKDYIYD